MTWQEALEQEVAATGHEKYRQLCDEANPDHGIWRARMLRRWGGDPGEYPSLVQQGVNAVKAGVRVARAVVRREKVIVSQDEQDRRLAICQACSFFDAKQFRCRKCGCGLSLKARISSEKCPIDKW
jgi:hypothetical protein